MGRKSGEITHPLNVLEDCSLISKEPDVFRRGKWTYRVTEPLINFYEAIMRPDWYRLEAGQSATVWADQRAGFLARVVGPHFESLCRAFAQSTGDEIFGVPVGEVGAGVVNDAANKTQIEVDVVVFAPAAPGEAGRSFPSGKRNGERSWGWGTWTGCAAPATC